MLVWPLIAASFLALPPQSVATVPSGFNVVYGEDRFFRCGQTRGYLFLIDGAQVEVTLAEYDLAQKRITLFPGRIDPGCVFYSGFE